MVCGAPLFAAVCCHSQNEAVALERGKPAETASQVRELMVALHINGQMASEFVVLLRDGAHYYATAQQFAEWRLRRPAVPPLIRHSTDYYPLDALPGITAQLDPSLQILYVKVPGNDFDGSVLQATDRQVLSIDAPEPGLFLNHDFQFLDAGGSRQITGLVEAGAFSKLGVITSSLCGPAIALQSLRWTRLGTQFIRDFPIHMSTLTLAIPFLPAIPGLRRSTTGGCVTRASSPPSHPSFHLPYRAWQVKSPSRPPWISMSTT